MTDLIPADFGPIPPIADELDEAILAAALLPAVDGPVYVLPEDNDRLNRVRAWYPLTEGEAEWCLRKYAAVEAREAEIRERHATWREPIDTWQAAELARVAPAKAFFDSRLQVFALARRAEDPKNAKTTRLPSGTIGTRGSETPKVVVGEEAAVIAWAQSTLTGDEYDAVVETKESVKLTGLRKILRVAEVDVLLTAREWEAVTGIRIDDPVGWRPDETADPEDTDAAFWWEKPLSLTDFQLRASVSTTHTEEPTDPPPAKRYGVFLVATGEAVPGCAVEVPDITASVKVDR